MIYILIAAVTIVLCLVIINYVRKLHWDIIHNNLLDLVDDIGGKVIRQGILGRPIYHGQYMNLDVTINFSTEKSKKGRRNLIDISIGTPMKNSFTISSFDWLNEREESALEEFKNLELADISQYGIRNPANKQIVDKKDLNKFREIILRLDPFLFLFVGNNGILMEQEGGNLAVSTRHPALKNQIGSISDLIGVIK